MTIDMDRLIQGRIKEIAASVSQQPLGLALHRPEPWAKATRCFENVGRKISEDGGSGRLGWTFHHRYADNIRGVGYLFLTHHAVWHSRGGQLIDVTPYPDARHRPLSPSDDILFLVDDLAQPVLRPGLIAPLPLRYFVLDDDPAFADYVDFLNKQEQKECLQIYESGSVHK